MNCDQNLNHVLDLSRGQKVVRMYGQKIGQDNEVQDTNVNISHDC